MIILFPVLSPRLPTRPHSQHTSHPGALTAHSWENYTGLVPEQNRKRREVTSPDGSVTGCSSCRRSPPSIGLYLADSLSPAPLPVLLVWRVGWVFLTGHLQKALAIRALLLVVGTSFPPWGRCSTHSRSFPRVEEQATLGFSDFPPKEKQGVGSARHRRMRRERGISCSAWRSIWVGWGPGGEREAQRSQVDRGSI